MQGFKNYRVVQREVDNFKTPLSFATALGDMCISVPVEALWTDKYRAKMLTVTVNKTSDAVTVARQLRKFFPFMSISSKNSIRVIFDVFDEEVLSKIKSVAGVACVVLDADFLAGKTPSYLGYRKSSGQNALNTLNVHPVQDLDIKVSTTSSVPISGEVLVQCKLLIEFLRCVFLRTSSDGCVWVKAGTEELAELLHERVSSGFRFCWVKAPQTDN
jgi:hypothetical protein